MEIHQRSVMSIYFMEVYLKDPISIPQRYKAVIYHRDSGKHRSPVCLFLVVLFFIDRDVTFANINKS